VQPVTEGHVVKRYDSELRDLLNRMLGRGAGHRASAPGTRCGFR